jgi:hypothetical protein
MTNWKHNDLAGDLGLCKGTTFLDIPLGSVWLDNAQRADVLEVKPSYTRFCVSIYEIKISRADFLSDIRSGKWRGYLDHCHRFYFATPSGMIDKKEIPKEAGLIVRGDNGWSTLKSAEVRYTAIPETTLMSLIFSKERNIYINRHREELIYALTSRIGDADRKKIYKMHSKEIAEALKSLDESKKTKAEFQYLIDHIREEISEGLGKEVLWPEWELSDMVREIKRKAQTQQ